MTWEVTFVDFYRNIRTELVENCFSNDFVRRKARKMFGNDINFISIVRKS